MNRIVAQAPSNIAIIKYMGKVDSQKNLPANPSLSMTLNRLRTEVELNWVPGGEKALQVQWIHDAVVAGFRSPSLSDAGIAKVSRHIERVFEELPVLLRSLGLSPSIPRGGILEIRSANTFPEAAGIASSASSFAALTLAAAAVLCRESLVSFLKAFEQDVRLKQSLSGISRQGSGSSCRSFDGPWVKWEGDQAYPVTPSLRMPELSDLVVLVGKGAKEVSSSEAHQRVLSSPLWRGRVERASRRVQDAEEAIALGEWKSLVQWAWQDFWEMHSLFHTAQKNFTYWLPESVAILKWIQPFVEKGECLVTMDAGPHVHILVSQERSAYWLHKIRDTFPGLEILEDTQGKGASLCLN